MTLFACALVPEEVRNTLIGKVIPYTRQFSGEALLGRVERAVRITYNDDALVKLAWEMARAVDRAAATCCGADDDQVSATAKLPALVARYAGDAELPAHVEAAVGVTNDNGEAVAYSQVVAKMMEAALLGAGKGAVIRAGGDSCGRGIILGAVLGAVHGIGGTTGIPLAWLLRVRRNLEAAELLARLGA